MRARRSRKRVYMSDTTRAASMKGAALYMREATAAEVRGLQIGGSIYAAFRRAMVRVRKEANAVQAA